MLLSTSLSNKNKLLSQRYTWRDNLVVHHVTQGTSGPPVLLLPGFGVGTFHYERNIDALSQTFKVHSLDLMGQGKSWPDGSVTEDMLWRYSVNNWRDQIEYFIEEIVCESVHIVGNSLGGYLGAAVAHKRPELVLSLTLLNSTPFWGFIPSNNPLNIWSGYLPAPSAILRFGSSYFDLMKNPTTVKSMLEAVYCRKDAVDDKLVSDILSSASNRGGHEAFTSILFSPKADTTFETMVQSLACPVCQINGREDPWITPFWGRRLKRLLPKSYLVELSPCGHCPHHEAPTGVNHLLLSWLQSLSNNSAGEFTDSALQIACEEMNLTHSVRSHLMDGQASSVLGNLIDYFDRLRKVY